MILTDYYRLERVATKAKTRLDCTASTESYPDFEEKRATKNKRASLHFDPTNIGDLVVYYGDVPDTFGGDVHRKADKSLTIKGKNLTSIYIPDPASNIAFGDVRGTSDAVLLVFHNFEVVNGMVQRGAWLDVFIARGQAHNKQNLWVLACDGEFAEEMSQLIESATQHHPATAPHQEPSESENF